MDIKDIEIKYENAPLKAELCNIRHARPHFHETSMEFVYCLRGSVELFTSFQRFTISENEICSIDCRDIHCLHSDEDNLVLICHLDLTVLDRPFEFIRYVFFACESMNSYPYQQEHLRWLERVFLSTAYIKYGHDDRYAPDYSAVANRIISVMMRYFNYYTYLNTDGYINQALYDRFHNVLAYCYKHHAEKIDVAQIARRENISKNYMSQFLRNTNIKGVRSVLKFIRCYEAEHLLLTSDISIAEASYACGFSDPKYFYPAFEMWFGRTPKAHRNLYKSFMEHAEDVRYLTEQESFAFIDSYMTAWFIRNTLGGDTLGGDTTPYRSSS